jgi:Fe-S cluster assembly protein SufD
VTIARPFETSRDSCSLGAAVPAGHGFFEALNAAAYDTGCVVNVPRGADLAAGLRLIVPAIAQRTTLPRLLVNLEPGAQATVVEEHVGGGEGSLVIGVSEILVGQGAEARHVLVQRWQRGTRGHLTLRGRAERDANFLLATASFGGDKVKADLGCDLAGPGARSEMVAVALAEHRQHLDHHTMHRHSSGHTWSNINFKAVVAGRARSSYTGLITIARDAPTSEAYQENRNLLLSARARADSIPELEILTDDVSCSHGATVAPVDPEQIFYLQSRGISAPEALRLVVRGFVEPTLQLVPMPLRDQLGAIVESRLAALQGAD